MCTWGEDEEEGGRYMMPGHLTTIEQTIQMMSMHTGAHRAAEAREARETRETNISHFRGLKIEPPKLTMGLTSQEWTDGPSAGGGSRGSVNSPVLQWWTACGSASQRSWWQQPLTIQLIPAEMMLFWQVHQYQFLEFVCNMLSRKGVVTNLYTGL